MGGIDWSKSTDNYQGSGLTHDHFGWKDDVSDNVRHSESYNTDGEGNVSNLHYAQKGEGADSGSMMVYDYHSGTWSDESE